MNPEGDVPFGWASSDVHIPLHLQRQPQISEVALEKLEGEITQERLRRFADDVERFWRHYPQLCSTGPEGHANFMTLQSYLIERDASPSYKNLVTAYNDLAPTVLYLNISVLGIGDSRTAIIGRDVTNLSSADFAKATSPVIDEENEAHEIAKMSADEYRKSRPELQDVGMSEQAIRAAKQAAAFFVQNHPEYAGSDATKRKILEWHKANGLSHLTIQSLEAAWADLKASNQITPDEINPDAIVSSGFTRMIDFGGGKTQVPETRTITAAEIARMSATEYAEIIRNPAYRDSVNGL